MKKLLMILVVLGILLSGCTSVLVTSTATNPTEIVVPLSTEEPTPTEVFVTPVPALLTTPEVPLEHLPVTLEDVKNVKLSYEISVNKEGVLLGLPEGFSEEEKSLVTEYAKAIQNKFLGSKVFYNKDEKTGNWLLFARLEKNLFHRVVSVDGGSERFADYPLRFEPSASGVGYKVADFYDIITLQSESVDVIWKEGIPQFVFDEVEILPNRDRYFTKYLIYDAGVSPTESNLWAEVPGVFELIASAPTPVPTDIEKDLNPSYVQVTDWEYMGVRIKAELITDASINPTITKVTVPHNVLAEFIARTVYKVWKTKGEVKNSDLYKDTDFQEFMNLWSVAQKSGKIEDWEKVQINNIWANNLQDGNGYVQKSYNIWPMYDGEKPVRAVGVSKISLVVVDTSDMKNITNQTDINGISYDIGYGTNLDGNVLYYYDGTDAYDSTSQYYFERVVDSGLTIFGEWLIENLGGEKKTSFGYGELVNILYESGLQVYP